MEAQTSNGETDGRRERLTALFIDFDNIYISLLSRDRTAATRFATNPAAWTSALLDGALSTSAVRGGNHPLERRMLVARVYGNPVLKNKDRSSFAYVRNHFMHAGYEVVDCPPLTNQLKNGSDIRMVLDMRDYLEHEPRIDEFVIMSGDSDFVPILLRLRSHDRRTMIFGGLQTARSYTSLADEIITEDNLVAFLQGNISVLAAKANEAAGNGVAKPVDPLDEARREIIEEVARIVENSDKPVSMELLATSVRNSVGLKRTIDTKWAGHGQFSLLLAQALSREFAVSGNPPFMVWHKELHDQPSSEQDNGPGTSKSGAPTRDPLNRDADESNLPEPAGLHSDDKETVEDEAGNAPIRTVIENILQITDIPPLSASYYKRLFKLIAEEIRENGFVFKTTAPNAAERGSAIKLPVDPEHMQIILHRVRRHGHWFSDKDDAGSLAKVFRDSVIGECLESGLKLTETQLDMIDSWFIPSVSEDVPEEIEDTENESGANPANEDTHEALSASA
jgi:hypothetical protein